MPFVLQYKMCSTDCIVSLEYVIVHNNSISFKMKPHSQKNRMTVQVCPVITGHIVIPFFSLNTRTKVYEGKLLLWNDQFKNSLLKIGSVLYPRSMFNRIIHVRIIQRIINQSWRAKLAITLPFFTLNPFPLPFFTFLYVVIAGFIFSVL